MIREWTMPLFCPPAKQSTPVAVYDMHYCSSLYIVLEFNILWWYSFEYYLIRCLSTATWIYETPEYHFFGQVNWAWCHLLQLIAWCAHLDTLEFLLVLWHGSFFYSYMHCTLTGNSRVTENSCKVSEENVWSSCQASSPRWGDCLFNVSFCSTSILQRELVQLVILAGSWATNAPKINIICLSKNWT